MVVVVKKGTKEVRIEAENISILESAKVLIQEAVKGIKELEKNG